MHIKCFISKKQNTSTKNKAMIKNNNMKKIIFLLIVSTLSNFAFGQLTELLISEYIEGSGYNKALEIFNGTGSTIDLSEYSLKKDINGSNDFSVS